MSKTILVCPNCGRLKWWPAITCVHCSCLMVNYTRWKNADEEGKKKILSEYPQPETYHPMYSKWDHPERLEEADKEDAEIRKILAEEEEIKSYTPKCPVCGCPHLDKIGAGSKLLDVAVWGFASKKPGKQFKCKACGYEF